MTEEQWKRAIASAAPTRSDDTVVLSGGRRASLGEFKAHVAADLAARAADPRTDG